MQTIFWLLFMAGFLFVCWLIAVAYVWLGDKVINWWLR